MEILKYRFAFFTIVLTFLCCDTVGYRADPFRQELSHTREDISVQFKRTDQLNISVVESPCVSGNTSCSPVTKHNGRQDMLKVNNDKVLLKYRSLIKAFGFEKKINRKLQCQLRSMENNFLAIEKVVNTKDRKQQSQLQSMEASISAIEEVANERYRELQSRLRSLEESIEDKISNMYRDLRNDMISFMTTVSKSETTSVKSDITTSPIYRDLRNDIKFFMKAVDKSETTSVKSDITTSPIYRDRRNDMMSVMTTVSNAETTSVKSDITTSPIIHTNCKTVPESGVYTLHLEFIMAPVHVYCDQETDGGGWIVFMRRQDGSVNFTRPWADYKYGFGSLDGEFWAGNELLNKLSKERPMQLRIDMEDFDGNAAFAMYEEFHIGDETDKYRLHVSGYNGTAGDSLIDTGYSGSKHAGMQFSTFDSDHDKSRDNCAEWLKSGWWYNECFYADLNAPYSHDKTISLNKGIIWVSWKGWEESLKRVEMKIR